MRIAIAIAGAGQMRGKAASKVTAADALRTLQVTLAVAEAARTGRTVALG